MLPRPVEDDGRHDGTGDAQREVAQRVGVRELPLGRLADEGEELRELPGDGRRRAEGERALVGVGSAVRPGIRIGADAVVGAGSAVVADVADGAVVGGAPARALSRA